jgi:hypothetical protein
VVASIPTKRCLPKWLAFYRGIPIVHRRKCNNGEHAMAMQQQRPQLSTGYALWMRGVELIGIHYRVSDFLGGFSLN